MPIQEGDILSLPIPAGTVMPGGYVAVGGGLPSIFIMAEVMGLATARSGTAMSYGVINPAYGVDFWPDDIDAIDVISTGVVVPLPAAAWLALPLLAALVASASIRRRRQA